MGLGTRTRIRTLLSGLFAAGLLLPGLAARADDPPGAVSATPDASWGPILDLGGKSGNERHLWELDLSIPVRQSERSLWFLDLRGRQDNDSSEEGNFGLAYRRVVRGGEGIFGVYGFYDLLHSSNGHSFDQGTLGAEYMARRWELRGNFYLPEGGSRKLSGSGPIEPRIVGNQIAVFGGAGEERAMHGLDVEVGGRLPLFEQDLWLRAGFFHFNRGGFENITGPRLSAEWGVDLGFARGARLTLGGEWQDDKVRGSQAFATARIRIPLGPSAYRPGAASAAPSSWSYARMQQKIRRDVDIVVGVLEESVDEPGLNPVTGEPFGDLVFAAAESDGVGSFEDPAELGSALEIAGPGGVVVALGDRGDIESPGVSLESGMQLVGGGSQLMVGSSRGAMPLDLPGTRPEIFGRRRGPIALAEGASGIRVQSLDLTQGSLGIVGSGNRDVEIVDVGFSELDIGVFLTDSRDVAILDSQMRDITSAGVWGQRIQNLSIDGNLIEDVSNNAGIVLSQISGTLAVTNNVIRRAYHGGISLSNSEGGSLRFDVSGNTLEGIGIGGIQLGFSKSAEGGTGSILGNTLQGFGAIATDALDGPPLAAALRVESVGALSVQASDEAAVDVRIEGNSIEDFATEGISVSASYGATLNARIANNSLEDTGYGAGSISVEAREGADVTGHLEGNETDMPIVLENHHSYGEPATLRVNACPPALSDLNDGADVFVGGEVTDLEGEECEAEPEGPGGPGGPGVPPPGDPGGGSGA